MGRDRDSPRSGLPEGFNDPNRSLTPHSARRIVTSGAAEIVVDDFIDAYLKERPKTIPEMAMYQPPVPVPPPPAPPPPAPTATTGRIYERPTKRGVGPAPLPPAPQDPAADREPATLPRGAATTQQTSTTRLLAERDQRISQLEEELNRVKGELQRASDPGEAEAPTRIAQSPLRAPDDARSVFRPVAPPRPGQAPKLAPMVRTIPLQAVAPSVPPAPQPAARNDATMMLPSVDVSKSSPPERNDATMMLPPVDAPPLQNAQQNAGQSALQSAPPPSAFANPPSAPPSATPSSGFAGTMIMDVAPSTPPSIGSTPPSAQVASTPHSALSEPPNFHVVPPFQPAPSSGPGAPQQGLSGLTPAPFFTPIDSSGPQKPSPFASPVESEPSPLPRRRGGAGKWIALVAMIAIAGGGTFAYLRGLGPMAQLRARLGAPVAGVPVVASHHDEAANGNDSPTGHPNASAAPVIATSIATSAPKEAPTASATAEIPVSPSASAVASAAAPAAASAAAAAGSAPEAKPATPEELKALLSFQAYLTVRSAADAEVVAQGQDVGRTNQRLVVRCGPRNVRLRGGDGRWLGDGEPVHIDCMQHTIVVIQPSH